MTSCIGIPVGGRRRYISFSNTSKEHQFPWAPTIVGSDDQGREISRYIPGESGEEAWPRVVDEAGLTAFARLLRPPYHDAVADYVPPSGTRWAYGAFDRRKGHVVCHGDFGPWNVVWQGLEPVGLLDWDFVYPGPALDDVAYALEFTAPFRDDRTCLELLGYGEVPDERAASASLPMRTAWHRPTVCRCRHSSATTHDRTCAFALQPGVTDQIGLAGDHRKGATGDLERAVSRLAPEPAGITLSCRGRSSESGQRPIRVGMPRWARRRHNPAAHPARPGV